MYNWVHINEKWFVLHADGGMRYIADDKEAGQTAVIHKSHIPKIMVLAAVARPWWFADGLYFDGKIGV